MTATELQTALAGFTCDKMERAWRTRSNGTQWAWTRRVDGPNISVCWHLAAALYVACGEYAVNGVFIADTVTAWPEIADKTAAYVRQPPEKAMSRQQFENRP